jgi:hypothetical protein
MTRRYGDAVEVRRRDDAPEQFLWRDRLYVVRGVLAHWVESGRWWRAPAARAVYTADVTGASVAAASDAATGLDDAEREIWRVEAISGRSGGIGVYDLCFDWSAGAWRLLQTLD